MDLCEILPVELIEEKKWRLDTYLENRTKIRQERQEKWKREARKKSWRPAFIEQKLNGRSINWKKEQLSDMSEVLTSWYKNSYSALGSNEKKHPEKGDDRRGKLLVP